MPLSFMQACHRLSSCRYFLPDLLAVGCKVMHFCSSPAFTWPSKSSAMLSLQHQKSQQTWVELHKNPGQESTAAQKRVRRVVKQWLFTCNWNQSFLWTESFWCPSFGRTGENWANIKSYSSTIFIMKSLLLPLHPDQNILKFFCACDTRTLTI